MPSVHLQRVLGTDSNLGLIIVRLSLESVPEPPDAFEALSWPASKNVG